MDTCARCGKVVYPTEKLTAIKKNWHRSCFKCTTCNSTIALGNETELNGQLFCKRCHQSKEQIKGYGFSNSLNSHQWNVNIHEEPKAPPNITTVGRTCAKCGTYASETSARFCMKCGNQY